MSSQDVQYKNLFFRVELFCYAFCFCHQCDYLLNIANCYQEAGLALKDMARERMDYIGVELAFMAHLCQKELQYMEQGSPTEAEQYRQRQRHFITGHLRVWLPDYCKEIETFAKTDFFKE